MRKILRKTMLLFGVLLGTLSLSVMFQNCAMTSSGDDPEFEALTQSSILASKSISILTAKCLRCHNPQNAQGGISNITDVNYLLYYRFVIPGQPDISDIVRVIREGSMPPDGNPVTVQELDSLSKWIQSGLVDEAGGVIIPGGSAPLQPTFASLNSRVISPKCTGCHNNTLARGGVDLSTYNGVRAAAMNGDLYASVTRPGANFMPQGGARLTAEELTRLNEWITAGAPNN